MAPTAASTAARDSRGRWCAATQTRSGLFGIDVVVQFTFQAPLRERVLETAPGSLHGLAAGLGAPVWRDDQLVEVILNFRGKICIEAELIRLAHGGGRAFCATR